MTNRFSRLHQWLKNLVHQIVYFRKLMNYKVSWMNMFRKVRSDLKYGLVFDPRQRKRAVFIHHHLFKLIERAHLEVDTGFLIRSDGINAWKSGSFNFSYNGKEMLEQKVRLTALEVASIHQFCSHKNQ